MSFAASLNRNKWFLLALLFLLINGWAVFRLDRLSLESRLLCPVVFEPADGNVGASRMPVAWLFGEQMVGPEDVGTWSETGPAQFTPDIRGRYRWSAVDRLEFQPENPWPLCMPMAVTLNEKHEIFTGKHAISARDFLFHSAPLELLRVEQSGLDADKQIRLKFSFNAPVSPAELKRNLALFSESGEPMEWSALGNLAATEQFVAVAGFPGQIIKVRLKEGLKSSVGPLGLVAAVSHDVRCSEHIEIRGLYARCPAFEHGSITFASNLPLDLNKAASFIKLEPSVPFSIGLRFSWSDDHYELKGDFKPGHVYTVTFEAGLPGAIAGSLRERFAGSVYMPNREKGLTFGNAGMYMSSRASGLLPVKSSNVRDLLVEVEQVYPNNLVQLAMRRASRYETAWWSSSDSPQRMISALAATGEYAVARSKDDLAETIIPLKTLLGEDACGVYYVTVSDKPKTVDADRLVVISDIGLSVKRSGCDLLVWANSIVNLAAVSGANIRVFDEANQELASGLTDENGLAHFKGDFSEKRSPFLIVASLGKDMTYLCLDESVVSVPGNVVGHDYLTDGYEAYVFTDRGIYRPGEVAHVKAVVRGVNMECPPSFPVRLEMIRPDARKQQALSGMLDNLGAVEFEVAWKEYDLTGRYSLQLKIPGADSALGHTEVALEEFAPPQIAVEATSDDTRGKAGDDLSFLIKARYLFGAPSAGNRVRANVVFVPVDFAHPDWPDFVFSNPARAFKDSKADFATKALDGAGRGFFKAHVSPDWRPPSALNAVFRAAVMDMDGRSVAAGCQVPVDVYPFYVGIRGPDKGTVMSGSQVPLELAAVLPGGSAVTGSVPLRVTVESASWNSVLRNEGKGRFRYHSERRLTPVSEESLLIKNGRGRHALVLRASGEYVVSVSSSEGGASASISFHVASPEQEWRAWSMEKPDQAGLRFDRAAYKPGEEALLSIRAPFTGKALLTIESDRVLETRILNLDANTAELRLPVKPEYAPNVYASLSLIRPVVADEPWLPHRATGRALLKVDKPDARLKVEINAPQTVRPSQRLDVRVKVTRADGSPESGAEMAIAAVDEGICMLTEFKTPNPFVFFDGPRASKIRLSDIYAALLPEIGAKAVGTPSSPAGDQGALFARCLNPVRARRFKPAVLWRSGIKTDAAGNAGISLPVPEFAGEMRVMAVAIGTNRFGACAQPVTVRHPLVVRIAMPRFLAPGDECLMPVELVNGTDAQGLVKARVECEGPLGLAGSANGEVEIAPGERAELSFTVKAGSGTGVGRVRVFAELNGEKTMDEIELPVRPPLPSTTEYGAGSLAAGEVSNVNFSTNWVEGSADYSFSAAGLPGVRFYGALDYLWNYPYGCLEQTVSGAFPLLYFADMAEGMLPGKVNAVTVKNKVEASILRVLSMQLNSGGFAFWPRSSDEYVWGSIYAAHFLLEAARAGHEVPRERIEAALRFLQGILAKESLREVSSQMWREDMTLRAYACHVLTLAGKPEAGWVARLAELGAKLPPDALAHVAAAQAAGGGRREAAAISRALGQCAVDGKRQTGMSLASPARSAALFLNLWLDLDPSHPDVPGLVARLEALASGGHWRTTQENAMALLAMGKYARWLSGQQTQVNGSVSWDGGQLSFERNLPAKHTWDAPPTGLVISNAGPGSAYFFWRVSGAPLAGELKQEDTGFCMRRLFFKADGAPHEGNEFTQGELYVVAWHVSSLDDDVENIVIEDLLPAGLEVENPNLRTSEIIPWLEKKKKMPMRHVDARDDRMLGFVGGDANWTTFFYAVRAVTPGDFAMPPLKASAMYDPGLVSVSGGGRISVVQDK